MVTIPIHTYVTRDDLIQNALAKYAIPLTEFRIHDAIQTTLPATAASDDLAIITGTYGSAPVVLQSSSGRNTTILQYARVQFPLPAEYEAGETITVRINAGMITQVAGTTGTVDVNLYANGAGADLCATAATTVNDLVAVDADFVITPTGLVPGDLFDMRIAANVVDAVDTAAVILQINSVSVLLDIKG